MWVSVSIFVSLLLLFLVTGGIRWVLLVFEFQSLFLVMGRSFRELIGYFQLFCGETPVPGFSFYAMRVVYLLRVQVPFMTHDLWECFGVRTYGGGVVCWHSTVCSFDVVQFACLCSISVELTCLQTLFWPAGISFLENEGFFLILLWRRSVTLSHVNNCMLIRSELLCKEFFPWSSVWKMSLWEHYLSACCLGEWLSAGLIWLQRWSQWQRDNV